jgi:dolichyl-phosphate beta-glucosyltransferase
VVPAYNEQDRLPRTLARLAEYYDDQAYDYEVIVVSDGSRDETDSVVSEFAVSHAKFRLVSYPQNRGKGYAVRLGMLAARGENVLFCDADLATPQEETGKLLRHMADGADVAIGSRPLRESNLEIRQPWYRELLGRLFNRAVQTLAIRGIDDTQCGFKVFTQASAQAVFRRCKLDGFSFDFEALMVARDLGYRIDEVPIRWSHVEGSKVVLLRDGPRMLRDLVKLRLQGKASRLKEAHGPVEA